MLTLEHDRADDDLGRELRRAVAAADFDLPAIAAGVQRRVGRIRRRRRIVSTASLAVVGTALVGGGALVLPSLLPSGIGTVAEPARQERVDVDPAVADVTVTDALTDTATDAELDPPAGDAWDPPFQDAAPPLPEGGLFPGDADSEWEIPDARPTGVGVLDALGAPTFGMNYRTIVPLMGVMMCDGGGPGVEPLTGQSWAYRSGGMGGAGVDIQVTGWADSARARDAIRDNTMTYCFRHTDGDWEQVTWAGHEGEDDYLTYRASSEGITYDFAVVRRGDYLVGVSVRGITDSDPGLLAAEIAMKTAANLEALDPVHGRD